MNAQLELIARSSATPITIVGKTIPPAVNPLTKIVAELNGARADLARDLLRMDWHDAQRRVRDAYAWMNRAQIAYDLAVRVNYEVRTEDSRFEMQRRREYLRLTDTLIEHARRDYETALRDYVQAGGDPYEGCRDPDLANWAADLDHRIRD